MIVIPYRPREVFKPYHNRTQRWAALVAHRRMGKTVGCINDTIRKALELKIPHGRYAYVAPYLSQGKEVAWDYLKRYARPATVAINESELRVTLLNGASIRIHGADNPDRLRGSYFDGVILDEYADMRPGVWGEVILPTLTDRDGWATFIGTPKGRNAFHAICYGDDKIKGAANDPEWFFASLPASQTKILSYENLSAARAMMTQAQYDQEYECSFDAAIMGAYYGEAIAEAERQGRVRAVPYQDMLPVHTAWDLGKGVNMALWFFQIVGREVHVIDFLEGEHSEGMPQIVERMKAKGYRYGEEWIPHDGRAVEIGTGRTRVETLRELTGRMPRLVPEMLVEDGINAARLFFSHCYFDEARCKDAIEALRQYRADYDEKAKVYLNRPKHDWTSHAADAFRYLAAAWREIVPEAQPEDPIKKLLRKPTLSDWTRDMDDQETR